MPLTLQLLDVASDPGSPPGSGGAPNEDAWGLASTFAWVIDGATVLSQERLLAGHGSDAAWLAAIGSDALAALAPAHRHPRALLAAALAEVAARFGAERLRPPEHAWERPAASIVLVGAGERELEVVGLGDCRLLVLHGDGRLRSLGRPARADDGEREDARRALARTPGRMFASAATFAPESLAEMRARRARNNTPGGPWVFGLDPEAAAHAWAATVPVEPGTMALLATDGFAALTDVYGLHAPAALVRAGRAPGLAPLIEQLRHYERVVDPGGERHPRYKRSDDATALLVEIAQR